MPFEVLGAVAVTALAVPSAIAVLLAFRRTRSPRLLLGALALVAFALKGLVLVAFEASRSETPELVEMAFDVAVLCLLLAALTVRGARAPA